MEYVIENWYIALALMALVGAVCIFVLRFYKMPTADQMEAVREWLLGAVTLAERELGNKTGRLKLRYCYDLFVTRFPWLAKVIPFSTFSDMVDDALEEMKDMLETNEAVKVYVEGETAEPVKKVGF